MCPWGVRPRLAGAFDLLGALIVAHFVELIGKEAK
jgi:hypothetical protein